MSWRTSLAPQNRGSIYHALTCRVYYWIGFGRKMPRWRNDRVAKRFGLSEFGCPRCGRNAIKERKETLGSGPLRWDEEPKNV